MNTKITNIISQIQILKTEVTDIKGDLINVRDKVNGR